MQVFNDLMSEIEERDLAVREEIQKGCINENKSAMRRAKALLKLQKKAYDSLYKWASEEAKKGKAGE